MMATLRYRLRLIAYQLTYGLPTPWEAFNALLGLIGAWQVIQIANSILLDLKLSTYGVTGLLLACVLGVLWWRLGCRPQRVFSQAARDDQLAERLHADLQRGLRNEDALETLLGLYLPLVDQAQGSREVSWRFPPDRNGRPLLSIMLAVDPDSPNPLSVCGDPMRSADWTRRASRFAAERQAFMSRLRQQAGHANSVGDEAGDNAVLGEIEVDTSITLRVGAATYGQIVRTSDSLLQEFALFGFLSSAERGSRSLRVADRQLLRVLPWRRRIHKWDDSGLSVLLAPRGRAAGLGVSVATLCDGPGGTRALVGRRSSRVGTYPGVLHVVPAGMVNLHGVTEPTVELVEQTMLAEFLEECFDVGELDGTPLLHTAQVVRRHLHELGLADLRPRIEGIAIDLLNLRPEVCGSIDLRGRPELLERIRLCWEYAKFSAVELAPLAPDGIMCSRTDIVQSGGVALALVAARLESEGAA